MTYELYYWPGIQGRAEFIRLALEEAGSRYLDVAVLPKSKGGGVPAILKVLEAKNIQRPPFRLQSSGPAGSSSRRRRISCCS